MSRNKTRLRLTEKRILRRENDKYENKMAHQEVCRRIETHKSVNELDYCDILSLINDNLDSKKPHFEPISRNTQVPITLKSLSEILLKDKSGFGVSHQSMMDRINEIDPNLNFRFLNRQSYKNIFLPKIKTRLQWQTGEFPFFKINAAHHNQQAIPFKNQRRKNRSIKCFVAQNVETDKYHDLPFPEESWAYQGTLYVTNLRLFFKRPKENFYIPFEAIIGYGFYNNCLTVEYLTHNQKNLDVFYVDAEQARLLETVIQITL